MSKNAQTVERATRQGSVVKLKRKLKGSSLGIVVSNDVQNEYSDTLLIAPLERRKSRLNAPFAVDVGRKDGFRDLHSLRCDWVSAVSTRDIVSIERARVGEGVIQKLKHALAVVFGADTESS